MAYPFTIAITGLGIERMALCRSSTLRRDGQRGMMEFAGDATLMYYLMAEAQEGKNAFLEKRDPDFDQFPKFPG